MRPLIVGCVFLLHSAALAASPGEIIAKNTRAIVYLQAEDANGGVLERGTGFVVSHDGYIVTADHVFPDTADKLWAVIGQRQGTRFSLTRRERNQASDVALWQFPQTASCHYSVTISDKSVKVLDRAIALGFPRQEGLTPSALNITNLTSALGFYKTDGYLEPGNSGGPVFDEDGKVIALVEGGTIVGSDNNDVIPVAAALDLMRRRGVNAGIGSAVPFDTSCYASCRTASNGVESWGITEDWPGASSPDGRAHSGRLEGGHGPDAECNKLIAETLAVRPGAQIDVPRDKDHIGESSSKDILGHVTYEYWCKGTLRANPIYFERQSPDCGLWN
ncbi:MULTISPECIES: serine protease [unclassified Mesorhizobium]|uniref:S1 family peptidase n=1 Tax=unclassified Mesorhizobium TaxID=325217 RepID=UPI0013E37069|nr:MULTISPECIES: serine protease [unclassified Mesorhizobium]